MAERELPAGLAEELSAWRRLGRLRELPATETGAVARDFCSNDYLGLSRDPEVVAAGHAALEQWGAGGRASRLLAGGAPVHTAVESACARWLGSERALLLPSGYQANAGLLGAVAGRGDVLFSDALNHASIVDGARLARARVEVYRHADPADLERRLARCSAARRRIVVSETVFSMDGDLAPVRELHELCVRHDAWLVLDEAHALGLLGAAGCGAWGTRPGARLLARVAGGGKALGVAGGLITGSARLHELLVNRARSFVFTTAVAPAVAGSLLAAIERCQVMDGERDVVLDRARRCAERLGLPEPAAAIVPVPVGEGRAALRLASSLQQAGFAVRAVRPPTVPEGGARLRLVFHAHNGDADCDALVQRLRQVSPPATVPRPRPAPPLFVVGTDTEVGKTVVSALLLRAAGRLGPACYWKPVQTGRDDDTAEVARLSAADGEALLPPGLSLPLPASPHEAAADAGTEVRFGDLLHRLRALPSAGVRIVELAGGLLVPYALAGTSACTQAELLAAEPAACVLVARSGLGTLNHTLLSLEALRARGHEPRALFLVGPPHASNAATLRALAAVPAVFELPPLPRLDTEALDGWLVTVDLSEVLRT